MWMAEELKMGKFRTSRDRADQNPSEDTQMGIADGNADNGPKNARGPPNPETSTQGDSNQHILPQR